MSDIAAKMDEVARWVGSIPKDVYAQGYLEGLKWCQTIVEAMDQEAAKQKEDLGWLRVELEAAKTNAREAYCRGYADGYAEGTTLY